MYDFLIQGGKVVDGTGNSPVRADVGIKNGLIADIGLLPAGGAARTFNAEGLAVCPGFIDLHTHSDLSLLVNRRAESDVMQGVTTVVTGNCGISVFPVNMEKIDLLRGYIGTVTPGTDLEWYREDYFSLLAGSGTSVNVAPLIGQGALRIAVMGFDNRRPSGEEMDAMKALLDNYMKIGVFGVSTGMIYPPGCFSGTEELVDLCRVAAGYGGFYTSHIRSESDELEESVAETLEIGSQASIPVHISHHKAAGGANWGKTKSTIGMMEEARSSGLDVTCDFYPYLSGMTFLHASLPPWLLEGGMGKLISRLKDEAARGRVRAEIEEGGVAGWWNPVKTSGGWDKVTVVAVRSSGNKAFEGMTVTEIAGAKGINPYDAVFDLLLEEEGQVMAVYDMMCEEDVERLMRCTFAAIASDGWAEEREAMLTRGKVHPRIYGTFTRVLGRYVRERKVLSLEEAVRKMTSLPARRLGLAGRGLLMRGMAADIVVFDPDTVADNATYKEPREFPSGISHVFVNGRLVVDRGNHTGALPGRLLFKKQGQ